MKRAATAVLILSLCAATAAMADGRDDRNDRHNDHGRYDRDHRDGGNDNHRNDRNHRDDDRRGNGHDNRRNDDHRYHHGNRWDDRNDRYRFDNRRDHDRYDNRYRAGRYYAPPGYRYRHWGRGDRLPRAYYSRPYVIANYHSYRLRPPPRGCHYVRVDNDVVLAAIATGVILDVFYNHFY